MNKETIDELLSARLASQEGISDLLFTVDRPPLVEAQGQSKSFRSQMPGPIFRSREIGQLADHIMNRDERLTRDLAAWGSRDCSYALKDVARFRVSIFKQNGKQAIVMGRLQTKTPTLDRLGFPPI